MPLSDMLFSNTHNVEQIVDIKHKKTVDKVLLKVVKTVRDRTSITGWIKVTSDLRKEFQVTDRQMESICGVLSAYYNVSLDPEQMLTPGDMVGIIKAHKAQATDSLYLIDSNTIDRDEDDDLEPKENLEVNPEIVKTSEPSVPSDIPVPEKSEPSIEGEDDETEDSAVPIDAVGAVGNESLLAAAGIIALIGVGLNIYTYKKYHVNPIDVLTTGAKAITSKSEWIKALKGRREYKNLFDLMLMQKQTFGLMRGDTKWFNIDQKIVVDRYTTVLSDAGYKERIQWVSKQLKALQEFVKTADGPHKKAAETFIKAYQEELDILAKQDPAKRKEESKEGLIDYFIGGAAAGALATGLYKLYKAHDWDKLVAEMSKNYPKICADINKNYKDDPAFARNRAILYPIDTLKHAFDVRIEALKKLMNMPFPSEGEDPDRCADKLKAYFGKKMPERFKPGEPSYMTLQEAGYLNSKSVVQLIAKIRDCYNFQDVYDSRLKVYVREDAGSQYTSVLTEVGAMDYYHAIYKEEWTDHFGSHVMKAIVNGLNGESNKDIGSEQLNETPTQVEASMESMTQQEEAPADWASMMDSF